MDSFIGPRRQQAKPAQRFNRQNWSFLTFSQRETFLCLFVKISLTHIRVSRQVNPKGRVFEQVLLRKAYQLSKNMWMTLEMKPLLSHTWITGEEKHKEISAGATPVSLSTVEEPDYCSGYDNNLVETECWSWALSTAGDKIVRHRRAGNREPCLLGMLSSFSLEQKMFQGDKQGLTSTPCDNISSWKKNITTIRFFTHQFPSLFLSIRPQVIGSWPLPDNRNMSLGYYWDGTLLLSFSFIVNSMLHIRGLNILFCWCILTSYQLWE